MTAPVTPPPAPPWPPPWARTIAFFVGIALMCWEAVVDHSSHLFVFGPAFMLTGLPIARGVEAAANKLVPSWGSQPPPPSVPEPEPEPETESA